MDKIVFTCAESNLNFETVISEFDFQASKASA